MRRRPCTHTRRSWLGTAGDSADSVRAQGISSLQVISFQHTQSPPVTHSSHTARTAKTDGGARYRKRHIICFYPILEIYLWFI